MMFSKEAIAKSKVELHPWVLGDDLGEELFYLPPSERTKVIDKGLSILTTKDTKVVDMIKLVDMLDGVQFTGDGDHDVKLLNTIAESLDKIHKEKK